MKWPWKRYGISDEQAKDSQRRLAQARAQREQVVALTNRAQELIERNHLGENIHTALMGRRP